MYKAFITDRLDEAIKAHVKAGFEIDDENLDMLSGLKKSREVFEFLKYLVSNTHPKCLKELHDEFRANGNEATVYDNENIAR